MLTLIVTAEKLSMRLERLLPEAVVLSNSTAALDFILQKDVAAVFLDASVPGQSGLDLIERVRCILPQALIGMLYTHESSDLLVDALTLGIVDFISLDAPDVQFLTQIQEIFARHEFWRGLLFHQRQPVWPELQPLVDLFLPTVRQCLVQPVSLLLAPGVESNDILVQLIAAESTAGRVAVVSLLHNDLQDISFMAQSVHGAVLITDIERAATNVIGRLPGLLHTGLAVKVIVRMPRSFYAVLPGIAPEIAVLPCFSFPQIGDQNMLVAQFIVSVIQAIAKQANKPLIDIDTEALQALTDYAWPGSYRQIYLVLKQIMFQWPEKITLAQIPSPVISALLA